MKAQHATRVRNTTETNTVLVSEGKSGRTSWSSDRHKILYIQAFNSVRPVEYSSKTMTNINIYGRFMFESETEHHPFFTMPRQFEMQFALRRNESSERSLGTGAKKDHDESLVNTLCRQTCCYDDTHKENIKDR
ncbi:hypothetical protein F2P81_013277 [Scophthalmus maximus]|uniref:Uncharacterized protein n=1 Tax=Scophthalmus maximus TaxID=52904 RepID=A0A6A4SS64_SCOMX|nr:hypothetical protein F2P81_013277 [Scophthalmus maximus]